MTDLKINIKNGNVINNSKKLRHNWIINLVDTGQNTIRRLKK